MSNLEETPKSYHCIFCSKGRNANLRLFGIHGVYICEECIANSYELLQKTEKQAQKASPGRLQT
jgi:ATP-dependent protease Clp ATPase subunit